MSPTSNLPGRITRSKLRNILTVPCMSVLLGVRCLRRREGTHKQLPMSTLTALEAHTIFTSW